MKEKLEIRINYDYANLLFEPNEGKDIGQLTKSVKVVEISNTDPRYYKIPFISDEIKKKYNKAFYFGWRIKRSYTKNEIDSASLFHLKINTKFEPSGEECGTLYDETVACEICGANRKQNSLLKLRKGSIPNKDIAKTIAGEIVVSPRFITLVDKYTLRGMLFKPVLYARENSDYFQLCVVNNLELSKETKAGDDPFNTTSFSKESFYNVSEHEMKFEKEVYKCPKGHLIGLNLISEPYILNSLLLHKYDIFATVQKTGAKQGLLRPEPIYLCSPQFRKMVIQEKLTGLDFEIARIVN